MRTIIGRANAIMPSDAGIIATTIPRIDRAKESEKDVQSLLAESEESVGKRTVEKAVAIIASGR